MLTPELQCAALNVILVPQKAIAAQCLKPKPQLKNQSLKTIPQKETKMEKRSLLAFFFSRLRRFDDNFAFRRTFRYSAQFGCRHVRSTCEGVAAFTTLPNAYAPAFNFDEATTRALVRGFESGDDFDISLADCCAVPCP